MTRFKVEIIAKVDFPFYRSAGSQFVREWLSDHANYEHQTSGCGWIIDLLSGPGGDDPFLALCGRIRDHVKHRVGFMKAEGTPLGIEEVKNAAELVRAMIEARDAGAHYLQVWLMYQDACPACGKDRSTMNAATRAFHPGAC